MFSSFYCTISAAASSWGFKVFRVFIIGTFYYSIRHKVTEDKFIPFTKQFTIYIIPIFQYSPFTDSQTHKEFSKEYASSASPGSPRQSSPSSRAGPAGSSPPRRAWPAGYHCYHPAEDTLTASTTFILRSSFPCDLNGSSASRLTPFSQPFIQTWCTSRGLGHNVIA